MPKRHVWSHLGSFGSLSPSSCPPALYFISYNPYIYKRKDIIEKNMKEKKRHSPGAQTMHLALFGPVLFVSHFLLSTFHVFCSFQPYICLLGGSWKWWGVKACGGSTLLLSRHRWHKVTVMCDNLNKQKKLLLNI